MNRILRLTFSLWLLLVLAACAPTPTPAAQPTAVPPVLLPTSAHPTAPPQSTSVSPTLAPTTLSNGLFFSRPQGEAGPLIAYDMANGAIPSLVRTPFGVIRSMGVSLMSTSRTLGWL